MKRRPKRLICLILLSLAIGTFTCQISHEQTHAGYILSHKTNYPDELVELVERNIETADFVYQYPKLVE